MHSGKLHILIFELCAGSLTLCTAILDEQFLMSEITISEVVIEVWS